jgi:predicted nucleotidyltransferase
MDWGFQVSEETIYLNPSNFGEVTTLTGGVAEGGFFYTIWMEERHVYKIVFKKLVDSERYNALKQGKNFDTKTQKYSHIREIQLYNYIKQFYRMFQTEHTEDRLDKLEQIAHQIEERIHDNIAMDVMGSTNMGLCEEGSDIDFVVYVHCDVDYDGDINT